MILIREFGGNNYSQRMSITVISSSHFACLLWIHLHILLYFINPLSIVFRVFSSYSIPKILLPIWCFTLSPLPSFLHVQKNQLYGSFGQLILGRMLSNQVVIPHNIIRFPFIQSDFFLTIYPSISFKKHISYKIQPTQFTKRRDDQKIYSLQYIVS